MSAIDVVVIITGKNVSGPGTLSQFPLLIKKK